MIKFSLLCPTRQRLKSLKRYIQSVKDTVIEPSEVEVLFVCDDDDLKTIDSLKEIQEQYKILNVSYYIRERSEFINRDYYNWLSQYAQGRFIWINADDTMLIAKGWDKYLYEETNKFLSNKPDRLMCANILDDTPGPGNPPENKDQFPCFPMFSKEVLTANGELLASQLPSWNADRYAWRLFTKVSRFLVINDKCYISHIGYHRKDEEADEITTRSGEICAKYAAIDQMKYSYHKQDLIIEQQAKILKDYINGKKMEIS